MTVSSLPWRPIWLSLICLLVCPILGAAQDLNERTRVLVSTSKGDFVLELYNETPIHRDTFLKNVRSGVYEGVQFHRVIKNFMIQAGHPGTKGLSPKDDLPEDSDEGSLPAEILPEKYIHERGALAAARQADEVNPEKRSSITQFYIVTGSYYTDMDLDEHETSNKLKYTSEQREAYKLKGGAPHLDGGYTVFGRLIDGFKIVDKIQRADTNSGDRPLKPIIIKRMTVISRQK